MLSKTVRLVGSSYKLKVRPQYHSFLPTSLLSSFLYFFLELYIVARLAVMIAPPFLQPKHRMGVLNDPRIIKSFSLLLLEVLVIIPNAIFTGVVGEFVPFSIGALAVIGSSGLFISRQLHTHARLLNIAAFNYSNFVAPELRHTSIPPSEHTSFPSRRSTAHSIVLSTGGSSRDHPLSWPEHVVPRHPVSSMALDLQTAGPQTYTQPKSARSSRTIDSVTAKSIRNAVIHVASRGSRLPLRQPPPPLPHNGSNGIKSAYNGSAPDGILPKASIQPGGQILPDQTKYAERFEQEASRNKPPSIMIDTNRPRLPSRPSAGVISSKSSRSPSSVVYGSDIVRSAPQAGLRDATRRHSSALSPRSSAVSSPRDSLTSTLSRAGRYSYASTMFHNGEMPVLYEASVEGTPRSEYISKPRIPTFGQDAFNHLDFPIPPDALASPSRTPFPSAPRVPGLVRGPRPPPYSPSAITSLMVGTSGQGPDGRF